ncbi:MAG: 4Fe-4S binding protein [Anaerolineales bacterium]|jgi:Pyruvate/2-oxoacid:ferredoxin oxidoreductase delta subunit
MNPYKLLALRLDALPQGYPATKDGAELRLLEKLFTPEEAELAAMLRLTLETSQEVAARIGGDPKETRLMLKGMAKRGLIRAGKIEKGLGFGLLPFVVGIYEYQAGRMDEELAALFEEYYQQAFTSVLEMEPLVHRVVPVNETIRVDLEVAPYESVTNILDQAKAWGVLDCICRQQKALIGDPCDHPIDVCMTFSSVPGAFDHNSTITALTRNEALDTLKRAADAGLVHSVSNSQEGLWYICNCCSCSCGVLRGMAEMGVANVIAKSSYILAIDPDQCTGCEECLPYCQFNALTMEGDVMTVSELKCVGCGVCVAHCDALAMELVLREEVVEPPVTEMEWLAARAENRGQDLDTVL